MKIGVGSTNEVKVGAVRETIPLYPMLFGSEVISVDVSSGISEQLKSMEETL